MWSDNCIDEDTLINEDTLKELYLDKSVISYILRIEDFSLLNNKQNKKQTYLDPPTAKEKQLETEILQLKSEVDNLKEVIKRKDKYIKDNVTYHSNELIKEVKAYNTRERQNHIKIIKALIMGRTQSDLSKGKYKRASGNINFSAIAKDLAQDLQIIGDDVKEDVIRKRMSEIFNHKDLENLYISIDENTKTGG